MNFISYAFKHVEYPYVILILAVFLVLIFLTLRTEFVKIREDKEFIDRKIKTRKWMHVTRTLIFICVFIAIASPFIEMQKTLGGDAVVKLIADNSTSMKLFKNEASLLASQLEKKTHSEFKVFGSEYGSDIGDSILSNIGQYGSILLFSDGNNNMGADLGDVAFYAAKMNATINAVNLQPEHDDARIVIAGPSKTTEGTEETFVIDIAAAGNIGSYHVAVDIDGNAVYNDVTSKKQIQIKHSFSIGYHKITAKLDINDYFSENNIYYKTVKVVQRPKILFVSEESSPLAILLNKLYDVDIKSSVPSALEQYYSVVINNVKAGKLNDEVDKFTSFISDGNGMVVVGGPSAFERGNYKDSVFELLLPSFVATPGKKEGDVNVVILIDISGSTGAMFGVKGKTVDVEKALAIGVLQDLKFDDKLAVIAFNNKAYLVSEPSYVMEKVDLDDKIASLQDQGGTLIGLGIMKSIDILRTLKGSKNIILISDGQSQQDDDAIASAKLAANNGIKIYTVGVGPSTNEILMKQLASLSNGIYFRATDSSRLKILFGDVDKNRQSNEFSLVVLDRDHFITSDLDLKATITGYNAVVPKSTAKMLVTTDNGNPIVNAWRLGLGKVITIATDDGTRWAAELLAEDNSKLIVRSMNWAIGDPERRSKQSVDIPDTRVNEPTEATIKSETLPAYENLVKIGENTYSATLTPEKTGFTNAYGAVFAANYPKELEYIGVNEKLRSLVESTGGKFFNSNQLEEIIDYTKTKSMRQITSKESIRWPFIIAAIVILLIEIFIRRGYRKE